jgi:uncharacterized protein YbjT (DUF2867 family)
VFPERTIFYLFPEGHGERPKDFHPLIDVYFTLLKRVAIRSSGHSLARIKAQRLAKYLRKLFSAPKFPRKFNGVLMQSGRPIIIAGARGFVGSYLAKSLSNQYHVIGLSRGEQPAGKGGVPEWRKCDLFSLKDAEANVFGAEVAFYLVHSMLPDWGLTQGHFRDLDIIVADNFARSAARAGIRQIIYLGGLIPDHGNISTHLKSRLEVERTLSRYGTPVTALRAAIVVGSKGSSFQIVERLINRLPLLPAPHWMETPTHPVALPDVTALLKFCIRNESTYDQHFDIGGPEVVSYLNFAKVVAAAIKRPFRPIPLPWIPLRLAAHLISIITRAPIALVRPLVDSLQFEMVAANKRLQKLAELPGMSLEKSVEIAVEEERHSKTAGPAAFSANKAEKRLVRSVQRLTLPPGRRAIFIAEEFALWLSRRFPLALKVSMAKNYDIEFSFFSFLLLRLTFSKERSDATRALFFISGGHLVKEAGKGRFEFRETEDGKSVLAAIHDYEPTLPWWLYIWTQARVHQLTMWCFGRFLRRTPSLAAVAAKAP